jgi:hypothetical protein
MSSGVFKAVTTGKKEHAEHLHVNLILPWRCSRWIGNGITPPREKMKINME